MESMKTITFVDEDTGEEQTYAVLGPAVVGSGELAANGQELILEFSDGVTDLDFVSIGVAEATGDYFYININGIDASFVTGSAGYNNDIDLKLRKVGEYWTVTGNLADAVSKVKTMLNKNSIEKINSIGIKAYGSATPLFAGHKVYAEGR